MGASVERKGVDLEVVEVRKGIGVSFERDPFVDLV